MEYYKQLIDIIKNKSSRELSKIIKNEVIEATSFLPDNTEMTTRLWYISNQKITQELCPVCTSVPVNVKIRKGDVCIQTCSLSCAHKRKDSDGKTKTQKAIEKSKKTKRLVGDDGLTGYQRTARKSAFTMSIPDNNGLTTYDKSKHKIKKSNKKVGDDGLTGYQRTGLKNSEILSVVGDDGLTGYQRNGLKTKNTNIDKWFTNYVKNFDTDFEILSTLETYKKTKLIKYKCKTCNNIRESASKYVRCIVCNPYTQSIPETEIINFCQSMVDDIIIKDRQIIKPKELDIFIPSKQLAIEYDGLFWHSYGLGYEENAEDKNKHLLKTQRCEENGIQLLHIFENEWLDTTKQSIWKSIISNKLGKSNKLYARKCDIRIVAQNEKEQFLIVNHLQGDCSSSVNIGLYYQDILVSMMTFGKSRFNKNYDWELLRFCNKLNTTVVGGASKLLKYFKMNHTGSIISYADKRRSNGNLYKQLGFEHLHDSPPNYWYYKHGTMILESRIKYQKHKLHKLLDCYDSSKSESYNMYHNKFRKIYDCGSQCWVLTKTINSLNILS